MTLIPANPRRLLMVGDTHRSLSWWKNHILPIHDENPFDIVVQLGDFGIWPGVPGQEYLDGLNEALKARNLPCVFIDGNHDDFEQLLSIPVRPDGWRQVRPHIIHAPRGHRWEWNGVKFLALGGAASIDKETRTMFVNWWPQEQITYADVNTCLATDEKCDVMLTHDAPLDIRYKSSLHQASYSNRMALQAVLEHDEPRLLFHGHWHDARQSVIRRGSKLPLTVISLACNGMKGNCAALDLETLKINQQVQRAVVPLDGPFAESLGAEVDW